MSEANAPTGKKPRKRASRTRGALVREGGTPFTISLFDGCDTVEVEGVEAAQAVEAVAEAPAPPPVPAPVSPPPPAPVRAIRAAKTASPVTTLSLLTLPFGDDEDAAETGEPSYRVLFDSTVWALRPDSGDFIHVGTGEIRDEESFTFPTDLRSDYADMPDDWDVPQVRP